MPILILLLLVLLGTHLSTAHARPLPAGVAHTVARDGLKLALWERRPAGTTAAYRPDASKVVLLLHGATWSGRPDFDLQIRDYSLMEALARAGYDAFALDAHGYGGSEPAPDPEDYCTADQATKDVAAAIEYIGKLRQVKALNLFGWSWGAHVAGLFAAGHPEQILRLVLYGFFPGSSRHPGPDKLPPDRFRVNSLPATQSDFIEGEFDKDVAKKFGKEALAACPQTPTGVAVDFGNRMPLFTPPQLLMPVLQIYGAFDLMPPYKRSKLAAEEFARIEGRCVEFFAQLATWERRYVVVPNGGHAVHLEKGHRLFQRAVIEFLNLGPPLPGRPFPLPQPGPPGPPGPER